MASTMQSMKSSNMLGRCTPVRARRVGPVASVSTSVGVTCSVAVKESASYTVRGTVRKVNEDRFAVKVRLEHLVRHLQMLHSLVTQLMVCMLSGKKGTIHAICLTSITRSYGHRVTMGANSCSVLRCAEGPLDVTKAGAAPNLTIASTHS